MARGENPGMVLSIETTLDYDKDERYGHASAGKDLVLSILGSGANIGKGQLGADGANIAGKFLDLDEKGVASVMVTGTPMIMRKSSASLPPGSKVVCAGSGKIKAAAADTDGRGIVWKVLETGDNGRVLVIL